LSPHATLLTTACSVDDVDLDATDANGVTASDHVLMQAYAALRLGRVTPNRNSSTAPIDAHVRIAQLQRSFGILRRHGADIARTGQRISATIGTSSANAALRVLAEWEPALRPNRQKGLRSLVGCVRSHSSQEP
jgi:hypothetical protein